MFTNNLKPLFILLFLISFSFVMQAQASDSKSIFNDWYKKYDINSTQKSSDLLVTIGKSFLDVPYVANTLDKDTIETLVVNWDELDCTTFVENCIALTFALKEFDQALFENYTSILQNLRYKSGVINGYASRNHYMTSWITNNQKYFTNMSPNLGGVRDHKVINFMSNHVSSYPILSGDTSQIKYIQATEQEIYKDGDYTYISKSRIKNVLPQLQNGDIVVFATSIGGLDYSHIGIVVKENSTVQLLHASSKYKKVVIDPKPLDQYCQDSKSNVGITILRLK